MTLEVISRCACCDGPIRHKPGEIRWWCSPCRTGLLAAIHAFDAREAIRKTVQR